MIRIDSGNDRPTLRVDSITEHKDGYLIIRGTVAVEGAKLEYLDPEMPGGKRVERVMRSALEDAQSLIGVPLTIEHPKPRGTRVKNYNYDHTASGHIVAAEFDPTTGQQNIEGWVIKPSAIAQLKNSGALEGKKVWGLSPLYDASVVRADDGGADLNQIGREVNHVAITRNPRGGAATMLRVDSAGDLVDTDPTPQRKKVEDEDKSGLTVLLAQLQDNRKQLEASQARIAELEAETAQLRADSEKEPEVVDDSKERLAWFNERADALANAKELGVEGCEAVIEPVEIKRMILKAKSGEDAVRLDSLEPAAIEATWSVLKKTLAPADKPKDKTRNAGYGANAVRSRFTEQREDSNDDKKFVFVNPNDVTAARRNKE